MLMTVSFRAFSLQLAALLAALTLQANAAGTIKADRTNVRAKPAFDGEVLATLNKGEVVEVLDQVPGTGSDGAPRPWAKIALPKQAPVWVYGPLVDPKTRTVKSKVLNLRAGPGRNYSELGELSQGATVTVLREVDGWLLIEPPPSTFGFVSANLIDVQTLATPATPAPAPAPAAQIAPPVPKPVAETRPATFQPQRQPQPVIAEPAPQPATAAPVSVASNVVKPAPIAAPTTPSAVTSAPEVQADPGTNAPAKPRKFRPYQPPLHSVPADKEFMATGSGDVTTPREVLREGTVGRAWSVQAPGYHELGSLTKEGTIDFLISETPDIDLTKYRGHHVLVSGEEWRDSRWKTPLLKVKSIQLAD